MSRSHGVDVKQVLVVNMKKYHSHTLMYLHETIDLGSGRWGHLPAEGQGESEATGEPIG